MPTLLHVGCGPKRKDRTTAGFNTPDWTEIRLDIDPAVRPDVTGTMTDMSAVASASVDAVFSSHNIEHLYPHEVPLALAEFRRVLRDDGYAVITCPDLQSVAALVAQDRLTEPAYVSPAGPIAPLDILYGHRAAMQRGNLFMAHRCGFTRKVLDATLRRPVSSRWYRWPGPSPSISGRWRASRRVTRPPCVPWPHCTSVRPEALGGVKRLCAVSARIYNHATMQGVCTSRHRRLCRSQGVCIGGYASQCWGRASIVSRRLS